MLGIIDYGMGNIYSIKNATKNVGLESKIISRPDELRKYSAIILPGVGAFGRAMDKIKKDEFLFHIIDFINTGKYVLGICLGMQLLVEKSLEHGENKGIGAIEGFCEKFPNQSGKNKLIVPHTMWNQIYKSNSNRNKLKVYENIDNGSFFYFTHSYYVNKNIEDEIISKTNYCNINFCSAFQKENIIGVQFHPEKSGKVGLSFLNNFKNIIKQD